MSARVLDLTTYRLLRLGREGRTGELFQFVQRVRRRLMPPQDFTLLVAKLEDLDARLREEGGPHV